MSDRVSDAPPGHAEEHREETDDARPLFARRFPRDAALDALVAAFEAGNFARVRTEAPKLAASTSDPEVRRAALDLRAHLEPDPLARGLLAVTFALLVALSAWWLVHDGPPDGAHGEPPPAVGRAK